MTTYRYRRAAFARWQATIRAAYRLALWTATLLMLALAALALFAWPSSWPD